MGGRTQHPDERTRTRFGQRARRSLILVGMSLVGLTVATSSVGVAQQPASRIENAPATDFVVNTGLASSAVVVQLTTDNYTSGDGWTAAYACDTGFHNTSSLNNTASSVASNLVIVQTNTSGQFCVKAYKSTDLIVDLLGTVGGASIGTTV